MRSINTLPATVHTFYRLMADVPATPEATSVSAVDFPLVTPDGQMPCMAYVHGGTPLAFSVSVPAVFESRTKSGKRLLQVFN